MARAVNGVKRRNLFHEKFWFYKKKQEGPVPKDGRVLKNHCISVKENSGIKVRKKVLIVVSDTFSRKEIALYRMTLENRYDQCSF